MASRFTKESDDKVYWSPAKQKVFATIFTLIAILFVFFDKLFPYLRAY